MSLSVRSGGCASAAPANLQALGPAWERLLEEGRSPTLGHAWACAWAEARGDELRVRVLSVPGDGGPGALLALGEERSRPGVLRRLGAARAIPPASLPQGPRSWRRCAACWCASGRRSISCACRPTIRWWGPCAACAGARWSSAGR